EQIHSTIVVEIKDRHAATHGLQQIFERSRRPRMFEIDLRQCGYVGKSHWRGRLWPRGRRLLRHFAGTIRAARAWRGRGHGCRLLRTNNAEEQISYDECNEGAAEAASI